MKLYRVLFQDSGSMEYYQRWYGTKSQAEDEGEKLVSDGLAWWSSVDVVDLPNARDRITRYNVLNLLNEYALVAPNEPTRH